MDQKEARGERRRQHRDAKLVALCSIVLVHVSQIIECFKVDAAFVAVVSVSLGIRQIDEFFDFERFVRVVDLVFA